MTKPKLRTKTWIQAAIRLCDADGVPAVVARPGDPHAGAVALKMNRLGEGCEVLIRTVSLDGAPAWMRATGPDPVPEAEADEHIERQIARDPDLWVLEIEDRLARLPFDEEIV